METATSFDGTPAAAALGPKCFRRRRGNKFVSALKSMETRRIVSGNLDPKVRSVPATVQETRLSAGPAHWDQLGAFAEGAKTPSWNIGGFRCHLPN